ncbi:MAG TPA: lysylphosphatidylglycerol synthase domain-containing protein [Candidatus Kapabacteria bacterium]|nr:lysylphosphatidylglycerol synthase domain-containing protein [Candidatus Kapabacteria bacterium]
MTNDRIIIKEGEARDSALRKHSVGKLLRRILTVFGVGFFLFLIFYVGWQNILDNIAHFGIWFVVILLLQMVWVVPPAFSWYIIQNILCKRAPLFFFLRIKIISDSMNTIIPTANLGGDALRVYLIGPRIPLKEGIAGILLDKTVESIAGTLFMVFGFLINILFFSIPKELIMPAMICLLVLILAITLFIFFQVRGFYRSAMSFFGWIPAVCRLLIKNKETLCIIDENTRRLYTQGWGNIPLTTCLHFMGRLTGVFEVMIIMWVLHQPVNFLEAWFISAAVTIGNTILFIVPGHWGVQEGMYVLVLKIMSFSPSVGLSLGIIRRIRRIFLLGLGLILFNLDKGTQRKGSIHPTHTGSF